MVDSNRAATAFSDTPGRMKVKMSVKAASAISTAFFMQAISSVSLIMRSGLRSTGTSNAAPGKSFCNFS